MMNYFTNSITSRIISSSLSNIQTRNLFILERRTPVRLHKKGRPQKILRSRNFVYDLVENTDCRKLPKMEMLLIENVDKYGRKGDVVSVNPYTAYEKLLVPGLGVRSTPESMNYYSDILNTDTEYSSKYSKRTQNILSHFSVPVIMSGVKEWTLEPWHIRVAFRRAGICAPDDAIQLPAKTICGPSQDIDEKDFIVNVTINHKETANVRCRLFLWTPVKSSFVPEFWFLPIQPLFEEDKELFEQWPGPFKKSKS